MQQRRDDVEPALVGHDDVEQDHVGLQRTRLEDRVAGVARLAHRLRALLRVEQQPQAGPDDRVVVDDQDAHVHASGTSATIVVPAPSTRLDLKPSVQQAHPLSHSIEPEAAVASRRRIEAPAVVLDHSRDGARLPRQHDADVRARARA